MNKRIAKKIWNSRSDWRYTHHQRHKAAKRLGLLADGLVVLGPNAMWSGSVGSMSGVGFYLKSSTTFASDYFQPERVETTKL